MEEPQMPNIVDADTALEEVMSFLDSPPEPGSPQDAIFGERLRQVIAASIPNDPEDENDDPPALALGEDLRRKLEAAAQRRSGGHPFGDHPDGIGRTLGMDLGKA
jgi:hypothetical protein